MAKQFNQETLDRLAEVLEIPDASATSILQSLLTQLMNRADTFALAYVKADEYSNIASEALYGAADNEDQLTDQLADTRGDVEHLTSRASELVGERDEAREIAGQLYTLAELALVAYNREPVGYDDPAKEGRIDLNEFLYDGAAPAWMRRLDHE